MSNAELQDVALAKLRVNPRNTRTHSKKQIRQIAASVERFGFTSPIIADEKLTVLAGHARLEAAKLLGLRTAPTVVIQGLSETERRAYLLADNKLAENAGWDRPALAIELSNLAPMLEAAGLDLHITGFQPAEIDILMGDLVDEEHDPSDEVPAIPEK